MALHFAGWWKSLYFIRPPVKGLPVRCTLRSGRNYSTAHHSHEGLRGKDYRASPESRLLRISKRIPEIMQSSQVLWLEVCFGRTNGLWSNVEALTSSLQIASEDSSTIGPIQLRTQTY